ncbi:hypothetical protein DXG01_009080 [Tephrocybe rancida]|nr:hypothetical protein DXG01_009080 [Tephrocybe rancida]
METSFQSDTDDTRHKAPIACMVLSQVCSTWRAIALGFTHLWTVIHDSYHLRWVEEMIARSKASLLQVALSLDGSRPCHTAILAEAIIERVGSLMICRSTFDDVEWLSSLNKRAPSLEELQIIHTPSNLLDDTPDIIFRETIPQLRRLTFTNSRVSWDSMIFRSPLTFLKLESSVGPTWTVQQVAAVLRHLPGLRTLALEDLILPFGGGSPGLAKKDISLPHLTEISVVVPTLCEYTYLLDCIALSNAPTMVVECLEYAESTWFSSLSSLAYVSSLYSKQEMPQIMEWAHGGALTDENHMTISLWRQPGSIRSNDCFSLAFPIDIVYPLNGDNFTLLLPLLSVLPVSNLRTLVFDGIQFSAGWERALRPLAYVEILIASNSGNLIDLLVCNDIPPSPALEEPHSRPTSCCIFPALTLLKFFDVELTAQDASFGLSHVLRTRRQHGRGIEILCVADCDTTSAQLEELETLVNKFEYNIF